MKIRELEPEVNAEIQKALKDRAKQRLMAAKLEMEEAVAIYDAARVRYKALLEEDV